ncbi:unnamed protein product, partial [marine sediment metagenome]
VIIITHNQKIAGLADRIIKLKDGKIEAIETQEKPVAVGEIQW